jgi:hypothetical protein
MRQGQSTAKPLSRTVICNPRPGDVVRPKRSRSGRCWRVNRYVGEKVWLTPIGDDVSGGGAGSDGRWHGGVRRLLKPWRDVIGWELVSEASR